VRILGLDTATWKASVGLRIDGVVVTERSRTADGSHAVSLLSLIEEVLRDGQCSVRDLEAVGVSSGPGSFTGLRIGCSVAKGLAYATGARLIAVPTLEALARTVAHLNGRVWSALDARKGELYAACFQSGNGGFQRLTDDLLLTPEALLALLNASSLPRLSQVSYAAGRSKPTCVLSGVEGTGCSPELAAGGPTSLDIHSRPCVVLGDAVSVYGSFLQQHLGAQLTLLNSDTHGPSGGMIAAMADERLHAGGSDDLSSLEPRYIRPSEAELKSWS